MFMTLQNIKYLGYEAHVTEVSGFRYDLICLRSIILDSAGGFALAEI